MYALCNVVPDCRVKSPKLKILNSAISVRIVDRALILAACCLWFVAPTFKSGAVRSAIICQVELVTKTGEAGGP
jgi:hypothetical protein